MTMQMNAASVVQDVSSVEGVAGQPIKVWDVPTRVFHWLLAASFTGAWLTAESERWRDVHVMLGYTLAGLIAFRVIWGMIGTKYARFSSFLFSPGRVLRYVTSLVRGAPEHHVGHNPAGAIAIFLLLGLGALSAASGFATYQEWGGEWLEELHEGAATAMLAVVVIHLFGVALSSLMHRENLVRAMITGKKLGRTDEGITRAWSVLGVALLVAVIGFWTLDRTILRDAGGGPAVSVTSTAAGSDRHHGDGDDDDRGKRRRHD